MMGKEVPTSPHRLSLPFLFVVDHSMFENLNTALTPKLQSSRSVPHLSSQQPPALLLRARGSSGAGTWVGSSQHLKSLGKVVGAKVNDFLRRKGARAWAAWGQQRSTRLQGPTTRRG